MTDLYTDEQCERIAAQMPSGWVTALHNVWNLSPDSPDEDWDAAVRSVDKLIALPAGAHELNPIRSMWLFSAMYMVERHSDQFHHKLQSEVVYHLIAALICDERAKRVRELRRAEGRLEKWRSTQRKDNQ